MKSYNGFPGWYRTAVGDISRQRMREGSLPPLNSTCDACGGTYRLHLHLEDYHRPDRPTTLCSGCHWITHQRFHRPGLFEHYKELAARGWQYSPKSGWTTMRVPQVKRGATWLDTLGAERPLYDRDLAPEWGHYVSGWKGDAQMTLPPCSVSP